MESAAPVSRRRVDAPVHMQLLENVVYVVLHGCQFDTLLDRVSAIAAELRDVVQEATHSPLGTLTGREREILQLVDQGMNKKAIAGGLVSIDGQAPGVCDRKRRRRARQRDRG